LQGRLPRKEVGLSVRKGAGTARRSLEVGVLDRRQPQGEENC
jgi:hypothetical protein